MRNQPYSGCVYADGSPARKPNVPCCTNVSANVSLFSVNEAVIEPRSCSRIASRGTAQTNARTG